MLDNPQDVRAARGSQTVVSSFSDRQAGAVHKPLVDFAMAIGEVKHARAIVITAGQIFPSARVIRQARSHVGHKRGIVDAVALLIQMNHQVRRGRGRDVGLFVVAPPRRVHT